MAVEHESHRSDHMPLTWRSLAATTVPVAALVAAGWWLRPAAWAFGLWALAGLALLRPAAARLTADRRRVDLNPIAFQGSPGDRRVVLVSAARPGTLTVLSRSMGMSVYDAYQLARQPPAVLVTGISADRAGELAHRLSSTGAVAVVEKEGNPIAGGQSTSAE